jgi:hypothetical protein
VSRSHARSLSHSSSLLLYHFSSWSAGVTLTDFLLAKLLGIQVALASIKRRTHSFSCSGCLPSAWSGMVVMQ